MGFWMEIEKLRKSIGKKVQKRLKEFSEVEDWFSELCFCILTANSRAKSAIEIQKEMGGCGFRERSCDEVRDCIKKNKHRFHNNKAKCIVEAREHEDIKEKVKSIVADKGEKAARAWLARNVKGIGYKEASHFMRNVGYRNLAILDRHIINVMHENGIIDKPKSLTVTKYLEIESEFEKLAKKYGISCAELDLYLWYMKTGEVLK